MMKIGKPFFIGGAVGALVALALVTAIQTSRRTLAREVLAKVGDEVFKEAELRKKMASDLIPIETDEYIVLQRGVKDWLHTRLLEKEAKSQGIPLEELYRKEIWSQVRVSYQDMVGYYEKTRELYPNQPLDSVSSLIASQLRATGYARIKEEYLEKLRKKYKAEVFLKKPDFFVENLALPTADVPSGITPLVAPSIPQPAAPTLEAKSGSGTAPSRGPETAPITLMEFSDFHCPFCKTIAPTLEKLLRNYPGKTRWVFRHYPLSFHPGADRTHEASACANEQGKFWEFHDAVFALPNAPQEADLQILAQKIGLGLTKFQECFQTRRYQSLVQQDVTEGGQKGVQGTPTVLVNDQVVGGAYPYEYFVQVIEGILNPGKAIAAPAVPAAPQPSGKEHGGAVLPSQPPAVQFDDLEGKPSLGPKGAPITLVEFSDFQCPFCKRVGPTLEQLMKSYPGKIRRVWRHYPLSFHGGAERAHQASECAREQGKFWEYHNKLFETQGSSWDDTTLIGFAEPLGLNKKKFEKCLKEGKYKDFIQKEVAKGNQIGVQGTPAIFVNGKLVAGAQPYDNFDQIVKQELAKS